MDSFGKIFFRIAGSCSAGLLALALVGCDFNKSFESVPTPYQPFAKILNTPPARSDITTLNVSISSAPNIAAYQYKLGEAASTDCSDPTGYSGDIPVATPITDDISGLSDTNIKICARAKDQDDIYQRFDSITSYTWLKDTVPPTTSLSGLPANPSNTVSLNITVGGTDVVSYRYKVGPSATTDCSVAAGYSVTDILPSIPITDDISNLGTYPDGDMIVCAIGKDIAGNEQLMSAATSGTWSKDFTPPTTPSGLGVGAVPSGLSTTPVLSWTDSTDLPMPPETGVAFHEVQILQASDNAVVKDWTTLASGGSISGLSLVSGADYYFKVRSHDNVGNISAIATSATWTATDSNESWTSLAAASPPTARTDFVSAWVGTKLFVWGGVDGAGTALSSGGLYDTTSGNWFATDASDGDQLSARLGAASVWTGNKIFIWGGTDGAGTYDADGATYDPYAPAGNVYIWNSVGASPLAARARAAIAWDGTEALIWGGRDAASVFNDGARYNPTKNSWTAMNGTGAPSARASASAVWTGSKLLIWGGWDIAGTYFNDGGIYDPATDTWSAMAASPLAGRIGHLALWTGQKMLVFGGNDGSTYYNDGALYDPGTDTWTAISASGAPSVRTRMLSAWTGTHLWVWGGVNASSALADGALYDVAADRWTALASSGGFAGRAEGAAYWTGSDILVWGGRDFTASTVYSDGTTYTLPGKCPDVPAGGSTFTFLAQAAQTFTVPAACTHVVIKAWGGGGAMGANGASGGGAGYACGVFNVTPGDQLSVYVADRGQDSAWGYGIGGAAENQSPADSGGRGGGASAVYNQTSSQLYLVAGGGGGGGASIVGGTSTSQYLGQGGAGGGGNGFGSSTSSALYDGTGGGGGLAGLLGGNGGAGAAAAGGTDGLMCSAHDGGQGKNTDVAHAASSGGGGGGGGGGYIGGGGGGSGTALTGGGGGGGGSNYVNTTQLSGTMAVMNLWASLYNSANQSDAQRPVSNIGRGQTFNFSQQSGPGAVLIGCY